MCVCVCLYVIRVSVLTLHSVLESPSRLDEEHRLIARYAARLAAEAGNSTVSDGVAFSTLHVSHM